MNYSYIQQNNEMVNATRRDNGYLLPYLSFLIASAEPESVLSGLAQSLRNVLQSFDELLCRGYLDSGYDDGDPRLLSDAAFDRWQDNERERCGSTAAEAAEAEIAFAIASRRADEEREHLIAEIDETLPYNYLRARLFEPCDCGDPSCHDGPTKVCEFYDYERERFFTLREYLAMKREDWAEYMAGCEDWD